MRTFEDIQLLGKAAKDMTIEYMKAMREFVVSNAANPQNKEQLNEIAEMYGSDFETTISSFSSIIEMMEQSDPFRFSNEPSSDTDDHVEPDSELPKQKPFKRF